MLKMYDKIIELVEPLRNGQEKMKDLLEVYYISNLKNIMWHILYMYQ